MISDGQTLLERCLLLPADATARKVFADWLEESGEAELAELIRGDRGGELLCVTRNLANRLGRFPCLKFLWGTVMVYVAETDRRQAEYERATEGVDVVRPGELMTLPNGFQVIPAPRGFFRRLFGG